MSTFSTSSRQKRLKTLSFLHFWLRNVLRATTACTFSTFFRHLNLQNWSEPGVFCTFWLGNVLRATTACNFSSLIWPAGSAPAALASLLFDPPSHKSLEKHSVSRLSYLFAHLHLLSSDLVSSDSSHLCFSTVHIVGSFTSKLPSIIEYMGMGWYGSLWNSLNEWSNSMTSHFCGSVGTPRTKDLTSRDVIFAWDKHTSV